MLIDGQRRACCSSRLRWKGGEIGFGWMLDGRKRLQTDAVDDLTLTFCRVDLVEDGFWRRATLALKAASLAAMWTGSRGLCHRTLLEEELLVSLRSHGPPLTQCNTT